MTLTYRIYYTLPDGSDDSVVLSGESLAAIREQAVAEVARRGGRDPWSEEIR
jgi:hypothetical protein